MEELIMQIIDIENRAQEVIKDAKQADAKLEERIDDETQKLHTNIVRRMEAKSASIRQMEEEEAEKKIGAIKADAKKQISALEEKYRQSKDKWVNSIVENIIG